MNKSFDYTGGMTTMPDIKDRVRIAVIGGGAAGFFAAVNTAEKNQRARITIFEAGQKPLQKVFISGGGRCNLTHACFDPLRLSEFYPRGQKELRSLFAKFQPRDTMAWFEKRGLPLKVEDDGRVFPISDCSQDVIDCLKAAARKFNVQLRTGARVDGVQVRDDVFEITAQGKTECFDACIISTGYSPPGWRLAESLGHRVLPPVPSLFPFTVKSSAIAGLPGISLPLVRGTLIVSAPASETGKAEKQQAEGALLITHTGLSGPLIYRLSAWGARELAKAGYQARLQLDLLPDEPEEALRQRLTQCFQQEDARKKVANTSLNPLPNRLWLSLLEASGADLEQRGDTLAKKTLNRLIENLKRLDLPITGKSPSKEEFVSCGGVSLKEVDFRTLQSRLVPGLYFGGEILDIDGLTGGFNFQACWSEGWAISEALKDL
jgi:predicted Rossmann fold flavoprotein